MTPTKEMHVFLISLLILAATPPIGPQIDEQVKVIPESSKFRRSPITKAELQITLSSNGTPAACKVVRVWHSEVEHHGAHPDYCIAFMKYHKDSTYTLDDGKSYATRYYYVSAPIN